MLAQLTISNFAIVRELEIDFQLGMTAITGETARVNLLLSMRSASAWAVALKPIWCVRAQIAPTFVPASP